LAAVSNTSVAVSNTSVALSQSSAAVRVLATILRRLRGCFTREPRQLAFVELGTPARSPSSWLDKSRHRLGFTHVAPSPGSGSVEVPKSKRPKAYAAQARSNHPYASQEQSGGESLILTQCFGCRWSCMWSGLGSPPNGVVEPYPSGLPARAGIHGSLRRAAACSEHQASIPERCRSPERRPVDAVSGRRAHDVLALARMLCRGVARMMCRGVARMMCRRVARML
jgi:hypothetical protein